MKPIKHGDHGDTEARSHSESFEPVPPALKELAEKVIGAAIEVHRELGAGFQEVTYHRALMVELDLLGVPYISETPVSLQYKGHTIGEGRIDLLVNNQLVIELKAAPANPKQYKRQVIAYLRATGLRLGLVINFEVDALKQGVSRVILD